MKPARCTVTLVDYSSLVIGMESHQNTRLFAQDRSDLQTRARSDSMHGRMSVEVHERASVRARALKSDGHAECG